MSDTEWGALHARVTKEEQAKARRRAGQLNITLANYIRRAVENEIENNHLGGENGRADGKSVSVQDE